MGFLGFSKGIAARHTTVPTRVFASPGAGHENLIPWGLLYFFFVGIDGMIFAFIIC